MVCLTGKQSKSFVIKRDGRHEDIHIDKITSRIQKQCYALNMFYVDPVSITLNVIGSLHPGIRTSELDRLTAEIAAGMADVHPDYSILATRIEVSNLHKETKKHFSDVIEDLFLNVNCGRPHLMIAQKYYNIIQANKDRINSVIIYDRDFSYTYREFKELEKHYLLRIDDKIVERPQHMLMRTAIAIHCNDIDSAIETYNLLSENYLLHASTTLQFACMPNAQLASSFNLTMAADSLDGIYDTLSQCGILAKHAGNVALSVHSTRAKGTRIAGTNGNSNGLVPMLKVYNDCARYFGEGGRRRSGTFTIYLEPWHADIFDFLNLKRTTGIEEHRARDLLYALWVPDLFMRRVEADGMWSLMCPHECEGLEDCWGDNFDKLYINYEKQGKYVRQVRAQELWKAIVISQVENGTPYMLYKDACNRKSNQKNLGTIKTGGFHGDTVQFCSPDEIAVGNSAWLNLTAFVKDDRKNFDFEGLKNVSKIAVKNLNKLIHFNFYPLDEAKASNLKHSPIGVGVRGLADVFILMKMPFESEEASALNIQIFETIYYGALETSCELAKLEGSYSSYQGSPASNGLLQYDMWNKLPTNLWDWNCLKQNISNFGLRNSLLVAVSPTENTSMVLGNVSSIQPYVAFTSPISTLEKKCYVVNQYLINDLTKLGLWNEDTKNKIVSNSGSIQNIKEIPTELKLVYKTVWEIKQKAIVNMAVDRAAFIDHSQSFDVFMSPSVNQISSMHLYGWKQGLKTGMQRLHTKS